jgi:hypothetical protein
LKEARGRRRFPKPGRFDLIAKVENYNNPLTGVTAAVGLYIARYQIRLKRLGLRLTLVKSGFWRLISE